MQEIVDELAVDLGRPVDVDDRRFRLLAYSSHLEAVDPVRQASILHRQAPPEVTAWIESLGVLRAEAPVRIPAEPRFAMAARVCVPVRFRGALLGFLWLLDAPPVGEAELARADAAAEELAAVLFRRERLDEGERERERELVRGLLAGEESAAAALRESGTLAPAGHHAVLVLRAVGAAGAVTPDGVRVRLAAALDGLRRELAPRHLLVLPDGDDAVAVAACAREDDLERRAGPLVEATTAGLAGCEGWAAVVGVGGPREALAEAGGSAREARAAARLAVAVPGLGPVARWRELGAYRTIALLAGEGDARAAVPPALARLLAAGDAATLVPTLETYLDLAGDVQAAAAALHLHRSTLYHRLHRVEAIAGVDLRRGDDRLELHLGLRLWRMAG